MTAQSARQATASSDVEQMVAESIAERNVKLRTFILRLLNPEDLGHAVTAEVRDAARVALGMRPAETVHG